MKTTMLTVVLAGLIPGLSRSMISQSQDAALIAPTRPVPSGRAPHMQVRAVRSVPGETVYAVVFHSGDEALSGLTDFAIANRIEDAHFTGIGAVSRATLGWLDLGLKQYHAIPVANQHEVLSLIGDVAVNGGKPTVHMHAVLGGRDGATVGGHVFELQVEPTLEVFVTAETLSLKKKLDEASGISLIDPAQ